MAETGKVDRQTTTPFLLRLFYKKGSFHTSEDFYPANSSLPQHVQIYTWSSCTLKELSSLLTTALPSLLPSPAVGTRLCFRLFYADTREGTRGGGGYGRYLSKDIGNVIIGGRPSALLAEDRESEDKEQPKVLFEGDADVTLADIKFVIGDYVSCAVLPPSESGEVAPPPRGPRIGTGFGGRENGFGGGGYGGGPRRGGGVPPGEWRRGDNPPGAYGGRGRVPSRGW